MKLIKQTGQKMKKYKNDTNVKKVSFKEVVKTSLDVSVGELEAASKLPNDELFNSRLGDIYRVLEAPKHPRLITTTKRVAVNDFIIISAVAKAFYMFSLIVDGKVNKHKTYLPNTLKLQFIGKGDDYVEKPKITTVKELEALKEDELKALNGNLYKVVKRHNDNRYEVGQILKIVNVAYMEGTLLSFDTIGDTPRFPYGLFLDDEVELEFVGKDDSEENTIESKIQAIIKITTDDDKGYVGINNNGYLPVNDKIDAAVFSGKKSISIAMMQMSDIVKKLDGKYSLVVEYINV